MIITEQNWSTFARSIAFEGNPKLHSPVAMERFMNYAKSDMVEVRTPHGKFKSVNDCRLVDFICSQDKQHYIEAEDRLFEKRAKLEKEAEASRENPSHWMMLAIFNEYRMAAEYCKASIIAKECHDAVQQGFAPGVACCFRVPLGRIVRILVKEYGYSRDDITLIWGGDDLQNCKFDINDAIRMAKAHASGEVLKTVEKKQMMMLLAETPGMRAERLADYGQNMRLGSQSKNERQKEIQRFQSGKSKIALFTYAAGGVGLSLHHTGEDFKGRPVDLLPRKGFHTPTYSAQDFVQGLGRLHRSIFSLSDTEQSILFFRDTIEEDVMSRVSMKLRCLKKVISCREQWDTAVWEGRSGDKYDLNSALKAAEEEGTLDQEYTDDDINIDLDEDDED